MRYLTISNRERHRLINKIKIDFGSNECCNYICSPKGGLAQLVERLHGMQEVSGSNPLFSTKKPGNFVRLFSCCSFPDVHFFSLISFEYIPYCRYSYQERVRWNTDHSAGLPCLVSHQPATIWDAPFRLQVIFN